MDNHFLKTLKKEKKQKIRDTFKYKTRYALVTQRDENGDDVIKFVECNRKGDQENLKVIEIGKQEVEYEECEPEEFDCDNIEILEDGEYDDAEKEFLKGFLDMENVEKIEVQKEQDEQPEVVERNYDVDDGEDIPIIEEHITADEIEEVGSDMDLRQAPRTKMTMEGKKFLLHQLFGEEVKLDDNDIEDADVVDPDEQKKINAGLDFFARDIKIQDPDEIGLEDCQFAEKLITGELSGSDMDFNDNYGEEFSEGDSLFGNEEEGQFKVRKPKKTRLVTIDMVNKPTHSEEDIEAYKKALAAETDEIAEKKLNEYINQNTKVLVKVDTLDDQYKNTVQTQKRYITEAAMIKISKTGVPKNVFKNKEEKSESEEEVDTYVKVVLPHDRPKNETAEQRKERKELTKEAKKLRRTQKAELKGQFAEQKESIKKETLKERKNVQGRALD
ncbi:Conserved_hypothetical protein [Hexamita inflata]|uniref:Uncharacterized protein n=1 Tax=Hexamita inflata TaxID=28002 RepID=A0AA86PTG1_9EUKA|nr:Conserved hypothetical protein [Hexamita inflata]